MDLRPARPAETSAILALWGTARSAAAVTEDTPESVALLLARDPEGLLVAEDDGAVVGAIVAGWDGWRGNLYRLAVAPGHRRRGIGRALVAEAHAVLRSRGARRVTALAAGDEADVLAFWAACGYARDDQMVRFVVNL